MARFDIYRFKGEVPLVVEVQADMFSHLASVVVIPLVPTVSGDTTLTRLNPILRIEDVDYLLLTTDVAAIPRTLLGPRVANVHQHHDAIVGAIDFLLQGF